MAEQSRQDQNLAVYLQDHMTGARTVIEMVQRRMDRDDTSPWLHTFASELEEERQMLEGLAERVGSVGMLKQTAGRIVEQMAQVKLQIDGRLDDSLRDLLELEAMRTGVEGKRCLIRSLMALLPDPRLDGVDLSWWESLAKGQAERLEQLRVAAATDALAG